MITSLSSVAVVVAVAGQMGPTIRNAPPEKMAVETEATVVEPIGKVWDRLMARITERKELIIDKADVQTRALELVFFTDLPTAFITCGSTQVFDPARPRDSYEWDPAGPSTYATSDWRLSMYVASTTTRMDGRARVQLIASEPVTKVVVDVEYLLEVTTSGRGSSTSSTSTTHLTSTRRSGKGGITCQSLGKLEQLLLDYATVPEQPRDATSTPLE